MEHKVKKVVNILLISFCLHVPLEFVLLLGIFKDFATSIKISIPTQIGDIFKLSIRLHSVGDNGWRHIKDSSIVRKASIQPDMISYQSLSEVAPFSPTLAHVLAYCGGGDSTGLGDVNIARLVILDHVVE